MSINWQELEISQGQLEEILNFDILSSWAIDISRVFYLRKKVYRKSLLVTELCSFFLVYLLLFPVALIIFRNFNWLGNNITGLVLILLSVGSVSIAIFVLLNYYLWRKAKQLKFLAIILEKVAQYNELIDNLMLVAELNIINSDLARNSSADMELKTALSLTRNSLIKSIELEKLINKDRNFANNRYQLLANLESGLINLNSLSEYDRQDYEKLLSEAIEIGLSVHQEIRKTQTLKQSSRNL